MSFQFTATRRFSQQTPATPQHTPMQRLFLDRLAHLTRKVDLHRRYLVPTDRRLQLLNRALLSTYDDCRTLGVETAARAILATLRRDAPATSRVGDYAQGTGEAAPG